MLLEKKRKKEKKRESTGQPLSRQLTYASIRRPSPGVVWVRRVELGARFQARGGHGIWTGQRNVTGKKTRLGREKIKKEDNKIYRGHGSTNSIQQLLLLDKVGGGARLDSKVDTKRQVEKPAPLAS